MDHTCEGRLSDLRILNWHDSDFTDDEAIIEDMHWLISNFEKLMSSESLRHLNELRLVAVFDGDRQHAKSFAVNAIEAIVMHQQYLKNLVLSMDYDQSSFARLHGLGNLTTLIWHWPQIDGERFRAIDAALAQHPAVTEILPYDCRGPDVFGPLVDR